MIGRFSIHSGLSSALVCINTCSSGLILSYQQSTPIVTACVQYSFLQLKKAILLSLKENTHTHTHTPTHVKVISLFVWKKSTFMDFNLS